ncbi:MAG TPA: NAD(P)/FAD-dependent oxidoreductase [Mycobacteriales bacterium]|nr:NAD(P)/FAD-dependent oxidoreductase [Mycobacteriales bacterium]
MTSEHIETVIIGGGQAGLSTGYHLQRRGRPFVILESHARVGDRWRKHWDTMRLYTAAKYDGLPGLPFPASPWTYPQKDEVAAYLERYAMEFDLPVRCNTRVRSLEQLTAGGFRLELDDGSLTCDNVVVATGTFGQAAAIPDCAAELDPAIRQLHSTEYHRPSDLLPGPVLVVGASHSGTDIAYEVAETNPVTLCGRDCGQLPFRPEQRRARVIMPVVIFVWKHVLTRRTPMGRKEMHEIRHHGGPMIRVHREDLAERGVERLTARVVGVRDGLPLLDDGTVVPATNVVWATGFRQALDWIRIPVIGDDGWPAEMRGVVDDVPGLFFCGLAFQYAFSSMVFPGIGRDAAYLADRIATRARERGRQPQVV